MLFPQITDIGGSAQGIPFRLRTDCPVNHLFPGFFAWFLIVDLHHCVAHQLSDGFWQWLWLVWISTGGLGSAVGYHIDGCLIGLL